MADKSALAWVSLDKATGVSLPQCTVTSGDDASVPRFELSGCRNEKVLLHLSPEKGLWPARVWRAWLQQALSFPPIPSVSLKPNRLQSES